MTDSAAIATGSEHSSVTSMLLGFLMTQHNLDHAVQKQSQIPQRFALSVTAWNLSVVHSEVEVRQKQC